MKKNILLIFMLIALATTSLWAQTTISFDGVTANDKDNGCNYTWPESNAYLTIQSPNVAGGCSYSIADGAVGLMYANLKVNLIPIGSEFESISVDIDAGCGEGCAKLTAYYQGQWVDETSNFETGASTLELWLWGTPVDLVVIEGVETTVDEIRLVPLQADVCNPFFTWYKNEDGSISFDFAGAAKLTEEYSWVFDFEEGYSAFDEANPTYSFKGQGDHNVCLTINKNGEQCAQFCDIIPEKDNCAADFQSYNNDLNPMKIDVQLSEWAIIPPNATLIWDMGDGTIYQDATKLDHVYSSEGNFTITLRIVLNETELCSSTNWVSVYEPQIKRIYTYKMKDGKYAFLLLDNKGYYEIGTEQVPDDWNREIVSAGKYTVNDANATYSFSEDWGNCSSSAIYDFLADGVQNSITFTQNADTCSIRKEILTGGVFRELSTCEAQLWYDNDLQDPNTFH